MTPDTDATCPHDAEAQIVRLTERMATCWNRNDGEGYAALFTADCDYIAFDGTRLRGRRRNADHHNALYSTVLQGSRLVFDSAPEVVMLGSDVALMHACGSVLMPWQDTIPPKRRSIQTYVVVREEGRWLIRAFHNSRIRPVALPRGLAGRLILAGFRLRTRLSGRELPARAVQ